MSKKSSKIQTEIEIKPEDVQAFHGFECNLEQDTSAPKLWICIPTGQRPAELFEHLKTTISAHFLCTYPNKEIVVINDGEYRVSAKGELQNIFRELYFPNKDYGRGKKRDLGLQLAEPGDYYHEGDDDDFVYPTFLHRSLLALENSDEGKKYTAMRNYAWIDIKHKTFKICEGKGPTQGAGHAVAPVFEVRDDTKYIDTNSDGGGEDGTFRRRYYNNKVLCLDNKNYVDFVRFSHIDNATGSDEFEKNWAEIREENIVDILEYYGYR